VIVGGVRVTATEATGTGVTVTVMLEVTPPAEALILAEPGLTAATNPLDVTDTIPASELAHVIARFERMCPSESVSVAVNCSVSPTTRDTAFSRMGFSGGPRIATAATGAGVRIAYVLKWDTSAVTTFAAVSAVDPSITCQPELAER
jgi:hypothetical protein